MSLGALLILVYWAAFTSCKGYTPKVLQRAKAAKYDAFKAKSECKYKKAADKAKLLNVATWALRVGGWVENTLLVLVTVWLLYLVGTLVAGSFVIFGYPV